MRVSSYKPESMDMKGNGGGMGGGDNAGDGIFAI